MRGTNVQNASYQRWGQEGVRRGQEGFRRGSASRYCSHHRFDGGRRGSEGDQPADTVRITDLMGAGGGQRKQGLVR
eukprot:1179331-Prorocentrum_minimum.AAC.4